MARRATSLATTIEAQSTASQVPKTSFKGLQGSRHRLQGPRFQVQHPRPEVQPSSSKEIRLTRLAARSDSLESWHNVQQQLSRLTVEPSQLKARSTVAKALRATYQASSTWRTDHPVSTKCLQSRWYTSQDSESARPPRLAETSSLLAFLIRWTLGSNQSLHGSLYGLQDRTHRLRVHDVQPSSLDRQPAQAFGTSCKALSNQDCPDSLRTLVR